MQELREIDRLAEAECGLPSLLLMENAGCGAARAVGHALDVLGDTRVLVLCGPGNNGGDGLAAARWLDYDGYDVTVALPGGMDDVRGDAGVNLHAARAGGISIVTVEDGGVAGLVDRVQPAVIVDALLGTGLSRAPEGTLSAAIEAVNRAGRDGCTVVALDVPSGLDADTGTAPGVCVEADVTVTFAALKRGFRAQGAEGFTGEVVLVPIGVPRSLLERFGSPAGEG